MSSAEEAYQHDLGPLRCCTKCSTWRPRTADNFFRDGDGPQGWSRWCKPCDRQYQRDRREAIYQGEREVKPARLGDARLRVNKRKRPVHTIEVEPW